VPCSALEFNPVARCFQFRNAFFKNHVHRIRCPRERWVGSPQCLRNEVQRAPAPNLHGICTASARRLHGIYTASARRLHGVPELSFYAGDVQNQEGIREGPHVEISAWGPSRSPGRRAGAVQTPCRSCGVPVEFRWGRSPYLIPKLRRPSCRPDDRVPTWHEHEISSRCPKRSTQDWSSSASHPGILLARWDEGGPRPPAGGGAGEHRKRKKVVG
jgi:hypothetical protein